MRRVAGVAIHRMSSSFPAQSYSQEVVGKHLNDFIRSLNPPDEFAGFPFLNNALVNAKIAKRHLQFDPSNIFNPRSYTATMQETFEAGVQALKELTDKVFANSPVTKKETKQLFLASEITNSMSMGVFSHTHVGSGFDPTLKINSMLGSGCVGGALNLSSGYDYLVGHPSAAVQIANVSMYSRLFATGYHHEIKKLMKDPKANHTRLLNTILPAILMGDASSSSIMIGEDHHAYRKSVYEEGAPIILDTASHIVMGQHDLAIAEMTEDAQVVLLKAGIPKVGGLAIKTAVDALLTKNKLSLSDIDFWAIHPGGVRVLQGLQQALHLSDEQLNPSYEILKEYGNCTSPTVLLVLQHVLENRVPNPDKEFEYGIVAAVGPGLQSNVLLLKRYQKA